MAPVKIMFAIILSFEAALQFELTYIILDTKRLHKKNFTIKMENNDVN